MNEEELIRETRKLIGRWDNIRIVGQGWAGDTRRGFQFNPIRTTSTEGTTPVTPSGACCPPSGDCFISTQAVCVGGGGTYQGDGTLCVPDPCTPDTGACCVGSDCSIESESDCIDMGGIFHGIDTTCSPNPCPQPTGACCVGTDCTIETESDCTGMGGTYQGDDTTCDPNPCEEPPPCPCFGFTSPYLPGRMFLTLESHGTTTITDTADCDPEDPTNCGEGSTCAFSTVCSGSGAIMSIDPSTCELTDIPGDWNSINTVRSLCESNVCTPVSPQPPASGTYSADAATFCGLGGPLTFTASGTTVHGTLSSDHTFDVCNEHSVQQYDVFYVFSNECTP